MNIMPKTLKLKISDGVVSAIYSDDLASLLALGSSKIRRVSHVEPANSNNTFGIEWCATMEDGTVLGPYLSRALALSAEVEYIERNILHARK